MSDFLSQLKSVSWNDRVTIAQLCSKLEHDGELGHQYRSQFYDFWRAQKRQLAPVIGISGPPGAGKSTLLNALGQQLVHENHRIGILTIDPSSRQHGGSLLGDKTRMGDIAFDDRVLIRPSPTSGFLGGIAPYTAEVIALLSLIGCDYIFVESVGSGQNEMSIRYMCHLMISLFPPGGGDELQSLKQGHIEHTDIVVVSKHDSEYKQAAISQYHQLQAGLRHRTKTSGRPIILLSAETGAGLHDLWQCIAEQLDMPRHAPSPEDIMHHGFQILMHELERDTRLKMTKRLRDKQDAGTDILEAGALARELREIWRKNIN